MRITAEEKEATRKRIVDTAKALFRTKGFDNATTRDIAKEVGMATGTLFNYFASKEAIVVELVSQALVKAENDFSKSRRAKADLEETLFACAAAQLRALRPLRKYVRPFIDTVLSPVIPADEIARELRESIHSQFRDLLVEFEIEDPSPIQMSIFSSLYTGVLSFWSSDKSPKQEDSLALLDQSVRMYVDWLRS